ncbi:hypothetical protein [Schinkia azotoformans]|uniref:hypothetical protein n=1 Tax=Schinkia azotoformans TaxID=1454 RepID=UPI002DB89C04|nr:hypothetical protein [Schinkia azotoformans]MEC1759859.1 hypothetical protein [Schinkia azotoformans]
MEKVNITYKVLEDEVKATKHLSCYRVDERHVVYFEEDSFVIDTISEETNGEIIVDADLDYYPIFIELENVDGFNINDEPFVNFLKYLIKVRDEQNND